MLYSVCCLPPLCVVSQHRSAMPVKPTFEWEQSDTDIIVRVIVKGFKADAVDVFISDTFVKVNAAPTYLLQLDLLQPIVVDKSGFWADMPALKITLKKAVAEPWDTLCIDPKTPYAELRERRDAALVRAEQLYNTKLDTREKQKEVEKKRMFNEHWEIERNLRKEIEAKVKAERDAEATDLAKWEADVAAANRKKIATPGDIAATMPAIRETTTVSIDFTPASQTLPSRSRGDEDYYLKSRYKPVSIEDAPMFWKEKGDKLYRARDWQGAADAYSESIKRDGSFMTCVMNRAACRLRMHLYDKVEEDCDLAMTMLSNTPASETTQERYKYVLTKIHVRRGAGRAWAGKMGKALEDFRMAQAYRRAMDDDVKGDLGEIDRDLEAIEGYMRQHGHVEQRDPVSDRRYVANHLYGQGKYEDSAEIYRELLNENEYDFKSRSNLSAALLQMGKFDESLDESLKIIEFCKDVAAALQEPGVQSSNLLDSDDEEDGEDEMVKKRNEAAALIRERSGHVYLLLKSYVRAGCAYCGKKDLRKGYEMLELAVRITPYDDDLRDDANRIVEQLRMQTLVGATKTGNNAPAKGAAPTPAAA